MAHLYGAALKGLAAAAALLLGATALAITLDVLARNVGLATVPWILEVSEYVLPLATFLVAPWLLYRNEHVRLDMLLPSIPFLNTNSNLAGLAVRAVLGLYGVRTILNSAQQGAMVLKRGVFPEWWLYAPVPVCCALLSLEVARRLAPR